MIRILAFLIATAAVYQPLFAQSNVTPRDSVRAARLANLARAWGYTKYFHPALPDRKDVDFDSVLIASIRAVKQATTPTAYAAAVQQLFEPLRDPLTRVVSESGATRPPQAFKHGFGPDSILTVTIGDYVALGSGGAQSGLREAASALGHARAVVFDLRGSAPPEAYGRAMLNGVMADIEPLLTLDTLLLPAARRRVYYGYENASPFSSGQYRTGNLLRTTSRLIPSPRARRLRSVFLINGNSVLTPGMLALQKAGSATIVYEGDVRTHAIGEFQTIELGDGLTARVRTVDLVFPSGEPADVVPDLVIAESRDLAAALPSAIQLARGESIRAPHRERVASVQVPIRERSYGLMLAPSTEYRLLSLFRFWNVIEYFYPYKDLLDKDWNTVLKEFIPIFEAAEGERAYAIAVAKLAARTQDSHAYVSGSSIEKHVTGSGYPGVRIRVIEDSLVVTAIYDTAAIKAGVRIGDVVTKVDGEDARARFNRVQEMVSASTPQNSTDKTSFTFLTGAPNSAVTLTVRHPAAGERDVVLMRRREDYTTLYHRERSGDVVKILPGNVGYVDLDRLTFDMIDSTFQQLANTRGIIFDMRGYPRGTIFAIAPRLTSTAKPMALLRTPMPGHASPGTAFESFFQMLEPAPVGQRYTRPTIMLMDERSVSQAEHTGLFLKAANNTVFVGSRTAGANGELATMQLPGGIAVGFSGQAVLHVDGRQLQRIGLIPDVEVKPTIAGIRRGSDEVLERARLLMLSRTQ